MRTWWEPHVRAQTPDDAESLFQPQELQVMKTPRWQAVRDTLWSICPDALQLFERSDLVRILCPAASVDGCATRSEVEWCATV